MARRIHAYVGLGSNVGDPRATLARAIAALEALPGVRVRDVSQLYATIPVGVLDQPDYLNAVVALEVRAGPDPEKGALALLAQLKGIEQALGRKARRRWGPREIDLDLLLFGRSTVLVERPAALAGLSANEAAPAGLLAVQAGSRPIEPSALRLLQVPHRDAGERLFVLAPLADLAPRLVPPGWRETVETARRRREAVEGAAAARPIGDWHAGTWRAIGRE